MSASPPNFTKRITQKDVARAAKVSRSTVTYALKNHPKIPQRTKLHIQKLAREMGYTPDPMLSSLAYYRVMQRPAGFLGTLAWLVQANAEGNEDWWKGSPHYLDYFNGAKGRCMQYGYQLEIFCFNEKSMSIKRVGSILRSRNIAGVILCPLAYYADIHSIFNWDDFSAITFGYSLHNPRLNTVASAHFQNTQQAIERLRTQGYQRIGLALNYLTDQRSAASVSSAFLGSQDLEYDRKESLILPYFYHGPFRPTPVSCYVQGITNYIKDYALDALLTTDYQSIDLLKKACRKIKPSPQIVGVSLPGPTIKIPGIVENSIAMGAAAVDLLTAMIQRGERGIPEMASRLHVEGVWCNGEEM